MPGTRLTLDSIDNTSGTAKAGHSLGRSAAEQLLASALPAAERHEWLCAFLRGFLELGEGDAREPSAAVSPAGTPYIVTNRQSPSPTLFAARITDIAFDTDQTFMTVRLDVSGSELHARPGSSISLWPSNDPEVVRDVIRALSVNAQRQVVTPWGNAPIWQVLLEHLNVHACPKGVLTLLAEHTRSPDEAQTLLALVQQPQSRERGLLALLRRFPGARPPVDLLLARLDPIQSMPVPIAAAAEESKDLTFSARISEGTARWGHLDMRMRARMRVGEWITLSAQLECSLALPGDDLIPTVVIASPLGCAFAHAFVQARHARMARGRSWVVAVSSDDATPPFESAFRTLHAAGALGRFDVLRGEGWRRAVDPAIEEALWRWIVDRSCLCLAIEDGEFADQFIGWLVDLLMRRSRLDHAGAVHRIREFEQEGRLIRMT